MEVSIQAVSPELGVHFSSTANFGSAFPAQAGGAGAAAAGAAWSVGAAAAGAAAGAGVCCAAANVSGMSTASAATGNKRSPQHIEDPNLMCAYPSRLAGEAGPRGPR